MNPLYKVDSKGKLRFWQIVVDKDSRGVYYEISHGLNGGKLQNNRTYVRYGKNTGRKNATTAEEQCHLEAQALWEAQINRKGYSETVTDTPPLKPMLAKHYVDEKDKVCFPCFIQPKLDGARCLAHITNTGVKLISRTLNKFEGLSHIEDALSHLYDIFGPMILDGELFNPQLSFQTIVSLVKKTKNLSVDSVKIQFWVYDIINENIYKDREQFLNQLFSRIQSEHIKLIQTNTVNHDGEIYNIHQEYIKNGFEGSIIRNMDGLYKINSRSNDLLKYKDFIDDEFKIVGYKYGTGKFENVPTFDLVTRLGNPFEAVPVGTSEQRAEYLKDARLYLGTYAKVKFFGYTTTSTPVPRHPVILELNRTF